MTTKEDDFRKRFAALMADLKDHGSKDPEAMYLLGGLANEMAADAKVTSWSALKAALSQQAYESLLGTFEKQGNALTKQGKTRAAYAMQVLAISLVARTQADPAIRAGEPLLDAIIDQAMGVSRKPARKPAVN